MIYSSVIDAIGNTPLIQINSIYSEKRVNLYAKCEFLNPGGSVKDRIGFQMIEEAESEGRIKPGDTIIEPTSGNTGIGLALAAAVKGYQLIVTMPEKMSREKEIILELLGAKIIRTPTQAAWDSPEGHIETAKRLEQEIPNACILDQYKNSANPRAHYHHTAQEILDDLQGKVDMLVIGAGTGGTITGVGERIKQACPEVIVVGVDPKGSILAGEGAIHSYKVEGIGYDFIPDILNRKIVDRWVKTDDKQAFLAARELILKEGLLCGGSSGAAIAAAISELNSLKDNSNCVVILPDGVRNYMSKFASHQWMVDNEYIY